MLPFYSDWFECHWIYYFSSPFWVLSSCNVPKIDIQCWSFYEKKKKRKNFGKFEPNARSRAILTSICIWMVHAYVCLAIGSKAKLHVASDSHVRLFDDWYYADRVQNSHHSAYVTTSNYIWTKLIPVGSALYILRSMQPCSNRFDFSNLNRNFFVWNWWLLRLINDSQISLFKAIC